MRKSVRITLVSCFILSTLIIFALIWIFNRSYYDTALKDLWFWGFVVAWGLMINEGWTWIKNGKRSEMSDLVIIGFLFFAVYLFSRDIFDSFIGAFSIYLLLGIFELKDYEVINKILLITVITYNVIFFSGIISTVLNNDVIRDTAFSMSFWLMLILGFALFGRKYIVVWRFMSPEYLTLGLYFLAWLGIASISKLTGFNIMDYIYEILIVTNFVVYIFTGPLLDLMLGLKPVNDPTLNAIINEVAPKLGLKPEKIKIRFGKYPILNAMAYGAFWDMRMGIIAPSLDKIPKDELKGIVAHELAHSRGLHTLTLTLISTMEIIIRKILDWPVTYYDYVFAPEEQPYSMFWFILINIGVMFIMYFFVRMLEAKADLNTKRAGYGYELAKGLYNLESFYATGREIGLNTMLLCDEPITREHKMMDFLDTAEYLDQMIVQPTKGALLSNFLNGHPPSYHRIIASLHDKDISIFREAIMPLLFLRKKSAKQFFLETQEARKKFQQIATVKMKEEFGITSIANLQQSIKKTEIFKQKIGKTFLFRNVTDGSSVIGDLDRIGFVDDATESIRFILKPMKLSTFSGSFELNPFLYKSKELALGQVYRVKPYGIVRLENIDINKYYQRSGYKGTKLSRFEDQDKRTGTMTLIPLNGTKNYPANKPVEAAIFKSRLSKPMQYLEALYNQPIFLKNKSNILIKILENIEFSPDFSRFTIKIRDYENDTGHEVLKSEEISLSFGRIILPIHYDEMTYESERKILQFLKTSLIRTSLFLKKAVNVDEHGNILEIIEQDGIENNNEKQKSSQTFKKTLRIKIRNIFGQEKEVISKKIDAISFDLPTILISRKKDLSTSSKIAYWITAWFHPDRILF